MPRSPSSAALVALLSTLMLVNACAGGGKENPQDGGSGGGAGGGSGGGGGGSSQAGVCVESCTDSVQCAVNSVCEGGKCACTKNEHCWPTGTDRGCTANSDCSSSQRCIKWEGSTFCSTLASSSPPYCGLSSPLTLVTVELAESTDTVQVCMDKRKECRYAKCVLPCSTCSLYPFGLSECNTDTGLCQCTKTPEDSCTKAHPGRQCRADGTCGCKEDSICGQGQTCDVATGECVECQESSDCSGDRVCSNGKCACKVGSTGCGPISGGTNPGTTWTCEAQ